MNIESILKNLNKLPPAKTRIKNAWITVNRACNMHCPWCYARDALSSTSSNVNLIKAKKVIDLLFAIGIEEIILLGGEPTLFDHLIELVEYISTKKIRITLVTNGLKLSDYSYCIKLRDAGVSFINISIKATSKAEYNSYTNIENAYTKVMEAISNVREIGFDFSVSYVLTQGILDGFVSSVLDCKKHGATHFSLSFCYDFSSIQGRLTNYDFESQIFQILDWFEAKYDEIDSVTDGNFRIKQSLPLCAWSRNTICKLEEKKQISYTCQVLKHSGIVFDSQLRIIPCNAMHKIILGKYETDYNNLDQLKQYLKSDQFNDVFQHFQTLPSKKCLSCDLKIKCRGGCISNWFNFTFEEFLAAQEIHKSRNTNI